jgi:ubiquinol-cytochrome c reductase cytochrome c1 subunit
MKGIAFAAVVALLLMPFAIGGAASAASEGAAPGEHEAGAARQHWTFGGVLGHFDEAQLQRGFKVYTEVCSRCHGVRRLAFRNLAEPGGPHFPEAAVKSLAATYQVDDAPDEQGKIKKRPATPADNIPPPYANEQEARFTHNGALPPDLSLMIRARAIETDRPFYVVPFAMLRDIISAYQEGGADYVHAYLTGYAEPPSGMKMAEFMNYNKAFPGHQTAMPNPFIAGDGVVKYDDDTPPTVDNYVRDVVAFLAWAADPRLEERKRIGLLVMAYLLITAVLLGFAKRRTWQSVH